jgi:hypothetical protein
VVAEHGEVFVSVVCEESALNDLHVVDVTVAIDAYVEGRTNLFAAHPRPTP